MQLLLSCLLLADPGLVAEDFLDWERVSDPRISPDAKRVIYTRRWVDKEKDTWASALWMVGIGGKKNRFLVEGSRARWSPDGTRIAYLADGQLWVRWMDAEGATTRITRVDRERGVSNHLWSPDGRSIAFTMLVPRKPKWTIEMPKPPEGATWAPGPKVIDTMHFRRDGSGFLDNADLHLFVVDADGGRPRQLTKGDWSVGSRSFGVPFGVGLSWTPDGEEIVFDASKVVRWRESHIFSVRVADGAVRQITSVRGPWGNPSVSPDGRWVAYSGYPWTRQTYRAADLYVIGRDGSGVRNLTEGLDRSVGGAIWDGEALLFTVRDRGSSNVWTATPDRKPVQLTQGVHMLSISSHAGGVAVGVRSAPHEPGDVVRFGRKAVPLTRVNADVLRGKKLGAVEEMWAGKVQGWIVKPPDFDAKKKYPLILHIHGGPHAMYGVGFNFSFQDFAANGYVVLYTNPRGSTGYGTDFGNAIDNAYPSVDHDDLMASVDELARRGSIDEKRMYVTGVSGGGVLSSWIVGHTDRFAAAAVRAPVTNWISFAGTTDIVAWGFQRFRKPFWEDPSRWLEHSPLMHVGKVETPTLMMCGELDLRTPMSQTEEYYQALKTRGVETVLLRFHGEYHGTGRRKPSNFLRTQRYLVSWFARH